MPKTTIKLLLLNALAVGGILLAIFLSATARGQQIPDSRRINWSAGVKGGIPTNRTNLINVKNAPYNARGDGNTDDKNAIQNAINAAKNGDVVYLPAGTYRVGSQIAINNKAITLRGAGPTTTTIKYDGSGGIDIIYAYRGSGYGSNLNINSGYTKGSTQLVLANASTVNVGNFVYTTQLNDPDFVRSTGYGSACTWCGRNDKDRTMTQINKVTAKSGNTVTLERPLYLAYRADRGPTLTTMVLANGIGIEDLGVWRTNTTTGMNIRLSLCENCWVKNVRSRNAGSAHIQLMYCYQCEVRDCWLTSDSNNWNHGSGRTYGVFLFVLNSDDLIENNIVYRCRHGLIFEGGGSGCVISYNYSAGAVSQPDRDWLTGDLDTHGSHPYMNLFEGNYTSKLALDNTFGSASHNTSFRNYVTNFSPENTTPTSGRWAVDIQENSYYNNVVGNVIGRQGDSGQRIAASGIPTRTLASYRYGCKTPGNSTITDTRVQRETLSTGNYDYIGGGVLWDSSTTNRVLPASMYYSSKPNWWPANLAWPAIGPDLNPMVGEIPASLRFKGQEPPPNPTPTPTPQPTPTPTPNPTPTPTPVPTPTPTPTPEPTPEPTPTPEVTPEPTPEPEPTPPPEPPEPPEKPSEETYSQWLDQLAKWIAEHPPTPNPSPNSE